MSFYKIKERSELVELMKKEKEAGCRIVLGGGIFDVFHIGFLKYLQAAKQSGELLVVAVNSDKSVKRIKNQAPLFTEEQRMRVIAGLECVDYVFGFDEDTIEESIRRILPAVYAKGTDYIGRRVLETETAVELGIKVKLVGETDSRSVEIVKELNRRYLADSEVTKDYRIEVFKKNSCTDIMTGGTTCKKFWKATKPSQS